MSAQPALTFVENLKFMVGTMDDFLKNKCRENRLLLPKPKDWETRKYREWEERMKPLWKEIKDWLEKPQGIIDALCTTWLNERKVEEEIKVIGSCMDMNDGVSRENIHHLLKDAQSIIDKKEANWEQRLVQLLDLLCKIWLENRASTKKGEETLKKAKEEMEL